MGHDREGQGGGDACKTLWRRAGDDWAAFAGADDRLVVRGRTVEESCKDMCVALVSTMRHVLDM